MKDSLFILIIILAGSSVYGQQHKIGLSTEQTDTLKWRYDAFSYADFGTGEVHSYFSETYQLNPKLYAELQGFYDSYRANDLLFMPLRLKWYPTNKFYIFSGGGIEMRRSKMSIGPAKASFRVVNGVGYEPNKNITIEAVHDLNFNKNYKGINASPTLFKLAGKYRF